MLPPSAFVHVPDSAPRMPARIETVARQFDQRARRIGAHDALLREVANRMLSRLEYIRLDPRRILDIGCGLGRSRDGLMARYPNALWHGIDVSSATARAGRAEQLRGAGVARLWRKPPLWIVADGAQLPIADQSVDLVYSNLMLHWHPAPHRVLPEWKRVLRVDGLLMFSCFGPDTLAELRSAVQSALPLARPMPFVDMHDFGDMLVAGGFSTPVMDVERITLTFGTARALLDEVRALGSNPRDDRSVVLPSTRQARRLLAAIEEQRDGAGRIPLTFEIAYGHAWRPAIAAAKVSTVSVERLRAQLRDARPS